MYYNKIPSMTLFILLITKFSHSEVCASVKEAKNKQWKDILRSVLRIRQTVKN